MNQRQSPGSYVLRYFVLFAVIVGAVGMILWMGGVITGLLVAEITPSTPIDPWLRVNLTFDDPSDPWRDVSVQPHRFSAVGAVGHESGDACKWYGCAELLSSPIRYVQSTSNFDVSDGIAISFWSYVTAPPGNGDKSIHYLMLGDHTKNTMIAVADSGYGLGFTIQTPGGQMTHVVGPGQSTQAHQWTHWFMQYSGSRYMVWRNGELLVDVADNRGPPNFGVGDRIWIGAGRYNLFMRGYLDELLIWNRANFSTSDVVALYDSQREGTPPEVDVYIASVEYDLPFDWSDSRNRLVVESLPLTVRIGNAGVQEASNTGYRVIVGDSVVCEGQVTIMPRSEVDVLCEWDSSYGFHVGEVVLDAPPNDVRPENDRYTIYIPMLNRPWFHFTAEQWTTDLLPFSRNPQHPVAYSDYHWAYSWGCTDFLSHWDGSHSGFAKKGRECAMSCLVNNYVDRTATHPSCTRAFAHLEGWSRVPVTTFNDVQAIHGLIDLGIMFDLLAPALTEDQYRRYASHFHDICQHMFNLPNLRLDLEDMDLIFGDNGKAFASGMGGFCMSLIGAHKDNPTMMHYTDQSYWGGNLIDYWMAREESFLRSFKDDPWTLYQEGWGYKHYGQHRIVETLWFQKLHGIRDLSPYNNALCSMGREMVTQMLDFTYLGKDLRGKGDHRLRAIARGDDFSYDPIGSMSGIVSDAMITYYGLLCDDIDTKRALLSLRDLVHDRDFKLRYLDMYLYPQLYKQVTESGKPIEIPDMFIGALMDNADDILTIRDGYSYAHDTVIQIDGGEERGSGHSMAQGYFLYAFGEPFLDYIQVPYRDDVRAETWRNGISLQNTAQMTGTGGTYSARCGNAPLNQFYGMMDCPVPRYSVDYPDFREFPLEYGGDLEHYVGTPDARVAGVYVWRPYKNADPVEEYFIKYEDTLIKRTVVSNNREGRGVFHNFINIYDEFDESRSGSQLTFSRQGVLGLTALDIAVAWDSTDSLSWGGGDSGVQYCFAKNSCSGHNRGKGTYRRTYLHTPHNDVDFILTHHWYVDEPRHTLQHIGDTDKGVLVDTTAIVFDTSDDGQVIWEDWVTDGWGLIAGDSGYGAFNAQVVSHGGVELIRLDQPASFYVEHDGEQIQFTINTMQRSVGIDKPRTIRVAVNAAGLTRNSDLQVFDSVGQAIPTQSEGTWATFDAISGQNSDTYSVRGDSVVNPVILDVVFDNQTGIIVTTDQPTNVSITYGERSDSLVHTILSSLFERVSRLFFSSAEGLVYAEIQVCTPMGQCVVSPELFTFSVPVQQPSQPPVAPGDSDSQDPIVVDPVIPDQPDPHDESPADPEQEIPTPPIDSVVPQPPVVPEPSVPLPNPATTRTTIHGRAIDATSAQISVQTDEQSDVSVWYRGSDGLWLETDSSRGYRHRFMLEQLFAGHRYEYQVQVCQDVCGNSSLASFRTPSVERSALLPSTRHFDGATTDVAALEDLERVPNMTLERQGMGTIRFKNELNASGLDLDSHIIIEQNRIVVMVDQLHQLNQPAELEFQSVEFENPIVLRNGELCPDDICVQIEYENGSVRVVVDRFSVFEVVDMTDYQPSAPEETHTPPSEQLPFDQVPSQEPSSGGSGDTSTGGSSSGGTSPGGSSSGSPDGGGSVGKETGETDPQVVDHVVDEQLVVDDSIVPVPQQSIQRPPNVETPKQVAMRDFRENIARPINMMLGGFIMVVFGIIIAVFVFDRWKRFIDAE